MRSLLLSLALIGASSATALAQDFDAAGKHFAAAQDAFGAKRYKTAAGEFEAAYAITKDPVLLYNIGEAREKAGDGKQAAASYRQYLKLQPEAQDKAEVQKRVRAIEAKHYRLIDQSAPDDKPAAATSTAPLPPTPSSPATPSPAAGAGAPAAGATATAAGVAAPAAAAATAPPAAGAVPQSTAPTSGALPPAATPATAPAPGAPAAAAPVPEPAVVAPPADAPPPPGLIDEGPPSRMRVAAWIGVASTLALLTAGAIFGLAAQSRGDEITRNLSYVSQSGQPNTFDAATADTLRQLKSDGRLYNGLGIGFFSASAATAVATVVLFVVDAKRPKPAKHALRFAPLVDRSAAGVAVGGSF
jgi:tetratricopeptide (TPR) repeat protein